MAGVGRRVTRILGREVNSHLFSKTSSSIVKKIKNHPIQWVPKLRMSGAVPPFLYAFVACIGEILPLFLHILVGLSIKENYMCWAHIMENLINIDTNLVGKT
jgi:hypothetical protein